LGSGFIFGAREAFLIEEPMAAAIAKTFLFCSNWNYGG